MWEKLKGLKTYLVNGAVGLLLALAEIAGQLGVDWHDIVPYQYVGYAGIALVLVNLILRSITTTPAAPILPAKLRKKKPAPVPRDPFNKPRRGGVEY